MGYILTNVMAEAGIQTQDLGQRVERLFILTSFKATVLRLWPGKTSCAFPAASLAFPPSEERRCP